MAQRNQVRRFNQYEEEQSPNSRKRKYPWVSTSSYSEQFSVVPNAAPSSDIFSTYEKTQGTGHLLGSEYQYLMCAFFALKCCLDPRIHDFKLTTNNNKYKVFDDIAIEVSCKDNKNVTFIFQLKHGEPQRILTTGDFARQTLKNKSFLKNPYCLTKHIDFIKSIKENNVVCVLYTNNITSLSDNQELDFEKNKVTVKIGDFNYADLLVNTETVKSSDIFHLKISGANCEPLQSQFYLFTDQNNVYTLRVSVEKLLKKLLKCDIYGPFDYFMRNWWAGPFTLTKTDVLIKLTELSLSPFMKTLSGEKNNQKSKQIAKCIMSFDLTIIESDDDVVCKIWEDVEMFKKITSDLSEQELGAFKQLPTVCLTAMKYGLTPHVVPNEPREVSLIQAAKIVASLSRTQISKVLWYLDVVPLVVTSDADNKQQVECILQLLKNRFKKKKIVLVGEPPEEELEENWTVFQSLSDLERSDKELYLYIVGTFYVSLQGRQVTPLKNLLEFDPDVPKLIGIKELLEMTQKTFLIGTSENVPDLYLPRRLSTVFVDTTKLVRTYLSSVDSLLIINCEKKIEFGFIAVHVVPLSDYLTNKSFDKTKKFVLSTNKCTLTQFDAVCDMFGKSVYLFQVFSEKCALLMKKGDSLALDEAKSECQSIEDASVLKYFTNSLNYVCASAGTGKSTLFTFLAKSCPLNYWSVRVDLSEYASDLTSEEMLSHFLPPEPTDPFFNKFRTLLLKSKKVFLFLDELDQVDFVDSLLIFIEWVCSNGGCVWVSSRDHLEERIVRSLKVVPFRIEGLAEDQQKIFLEGLQTTYSSEEIEEIVATIFRSVDPHLFDSPLHLKIIIEVLNGDRSVFEKMSHIWPATQIFRFLFEGFVKFFCEKMCVNLEKEMSWHHLQKYQILALEQCLGENFKRLGLDSLNPEGDKLGLIKTIEKRPFFIHSFAEYFASLWLTQHLESLSVLKEEFFSEKSQTLRFMFDVALAEENQVLLAVIYRSTNLFFDNLKDRGGRSVLHLACSYGMQYPCKPEQLVRDNSSYTKFIATLLSKSQDIFKSDDLFGLTPVAYAVKSRCLYPLEKILEKFGKTADFDDLFKVYDNRTLAYYAAQMGYVNLLRTVLDSSLIQEDFGGLSLLEVAVLGSKNDKYSVPREGNIEVVEVLLELVDRTVAGDLLAFACKHGCYDMMEVLVHRGLRTNGNTILQLAAKYGTLNEDVLNLALEIGVDVTSKNAKGKTLLHVASETGSTILLKYLLNSGASVNTMSSENRTPLHYAVMANSTNEEIIDLLIKKGVDVNVQDVEGLTALHLAQKFSNKDLLGWLSTKKQKESFPSFDLRNQLTFGKTAMSEKMEIGKAVSSSSKFGSSEQIFKKRAGTTDRGRDYEHLVMANLVLRLVTDNTVTDFKLSANDAQFGAFDDIVLNINTKSSTVTYALQLKHTNTTKQMNQRSLSQTKGLFSLSRYFQTFREVRTFHKYCDFIFFTNWKSGFQDGEEIQFEKEDVCVRVLKSQPEHILNVSETEGNCYRFEAVPSSTASELIQDYQDFFTHFFLYTDQDNVRGIENRTSVLFNSEFLCDRSRFSNYLRFISTWNIREGHKEKLDKKLMQCGLALNLLSPFIKPISFGFVNDKMKLLRDAISSFPVTIFEEENYDRIKNLWGDIKSEQDIEELQKLATKYQLHVDSVNIDDDLFSKLVWLMDKCPLILTDHVSVHKSIELCPNKKFIILGSSPQPVFETLADLDPQSKLYKDIVQTFKVSIQEKEEIDLEDILKQDPQFPKFVTTDDLTEMLQDAYRIGDEKEILCETYIPRFLSRNVISSKFLEKVDANTRVVLKREEFEEMCQTKSEKTNFHYCEVRDDGNLEWIESEGDVSDLSQYRMEGFFTDEASFSSMENQNKNNIVSGPPGSGKSQLLRSLKNQNKFLSILLNPDEIASLCSHSSGGITEFLLNMKFKNQKGLERKILKMLIEKGQVVYLWDGLDELAPENKDISVKIIQRLSKGCRTQFITCRSHVATELEKKFCVLSRHLRPFTQEEQNLYIQTRLKNEDISKIMEIKAMLTLPNQDDILGIPIQIFLFTELLHKKHTLSTADLYQQFVEQKYESYLTKINVDLRNTVLKRVFDNHKKTLLENYEKASLHTLFPQLFQESVQISDDQFGLVTGDKFVHSSFAEYFAASYFAKHLTLENLRVLFEENRVNVRFFFDLLLAKDSEAHVAVLQKNLNFLKTCDLRRKDLGGRSPLHVACSWGKSHSLVFEKKDQLYVVDDALEITEEDSEYVETLALLLEKCDVSDTDALKLTPLAYAEMSDCVWAKIQILRKEKKTLTEPEDGVSIVYYSAKVGYDDCVDLCTDLSFVITRTSEDSLLHLVVGHQNFLSKLLKFTAYQTGIDHENKDGVTALYLACQKGLTESVKTLVNSGAKVNVCARNGQTPLHVACQSGYSEIVNFLISCADINIATNEGLTPVHLACQSEDEEFVMLLIGRGTDLTNTKE